MATASARAIKDGATALNAFIVAMIWGYGTVGYGPYRTKRVITSNGGREVFGDQLYELAHTTIDHGGEAAFRYVRDRRAKDRSYLRYVGPAFGTKFTYFVAKAHGQEPAPVLDAVICRWFDRHVNGVRLVLDWFAPGSYSTYLEHLRSWRDQLGLDRIDDVERIIFQAERTSPTTPAELRTALESLRQAFDLQTEEIQDLAHPHLDSLEAVADTIL